LHGEFLLAFGGPEDLANERVRAWYAREMQTLPDEPNGEPPVDFWRHRFAREFPGSEASQPARAARAKGGPTTRTGSAGAEVYDQVMLGTAKAGGQ
jgi:hypothetical protein